MRVKLNAIAADREEVRNAITALGKVMNVGANKGSCPEGCSRAFYDVPASGTALNFTLYDDGSCEIIWS